MAMRGAPKGIEFQAGRTPSTYELRVDGRHGAEAASWFEDITLMVDESTSPVQTIIRGAVRDEAALYGLINRCPV